MIKVNVVKENDNIKNINISGHALYDEYGKDIVCAAVSSTVITTINGILMIDDSISYKEEKDFLSIEVLKENDITNKLLTNMINNLKELEEQYTKNIKIKEE